MAYHNPAGKPHHSPNRIFKIIIVVLMIIILGLVLALISFLERIAALSQVHPNLILFENAPYEEQGDAFRFMKEAFSYEALCASVGGNRGFMRYDANAIAQWSEICINDERVPAAQFDAQTNDNLPTAIHFCLPHGLSKGNYVMTMRLKDSPINEIRVYRWVMRFKIAILYPRMSLKTRFLLYERTQTRSQWQLMLLKRHSPIHQSA